MDIVYKNRRLSHAAFVLNLIGVVAAVASFILLYGFYEPLLSRSFLYSVQVSLLFVFFAEKIIRFINAENKRAFLRVNWFEFPLLLFLLIDYVGAGRWFLEAHRREAIITAITVYLAMQVVSRVTIWMVQFASSGRNPAMGLTTLFVLLICVGGGLLMLPTSHTMDRISFTDAVFTATSATCVTGLVVVNTGTDFTMIGQTVILFMMQLGGLGIVIFGGVLALLLGQALSMRESLAMQDLLSASTLSRIRRMIGFIVVTTLLLEAVGALLLLTMWAGVPQTELGDQQLWFVSIFHAVSAFCNAGFSLFSRSMIDYSGFWRVYTVIIPLIIAGGLGFGVIYNLVHVGVDRIRRFIRRRNPVSAFKLGRPEPFQLQTKIVLTTTAILILLGMVMFMLFETHRPLNGALALDALFQSVTARSAGFNSVDIAELSEGSKFSLILLMIVGGSPGSTTGGIKTVTLAVVVMVVFATLTKRRQVEMFRRSVHLAVVGRALTLVLLYVFLVIGITFSLYLTEMDRGWTLLDLGFEAASALGTVGLSTGVTPSLTTPGKWIIIVAMLIGRLGLLTLLTGLTFNMRPVGYDYPSEPLMVG